MIQHLHTNVLPELAFMENETLICDDKICMVFSEIFVLLENYHSLHLELKSPFV